MEETAAKKRPYKYRTRQMAPALSQADRVFCETYLITNDVLEAVRVAVPHLCTSPEETSRHGRNYMQRVPIKKEIERLKAQASARSSFAVSDALEGFLAIWKADPNDLVSLRVGNCRFCNGEGHAYQWTEREYVEAVRDMEQARAAMRREKRPRSEVEICAAIPDPDISGGFGFLQHEPPHPDCPDCGGEGVPRVVACDTRSEAVQGHPLYAGVKWTKYGPEVLLHDKTKALENVARIIGAYEDRVRIRTESQTKALNVNFDTTDPNAAAEAYKQVMAAGRT